MRVARTADLSATPTGGGDGRQQKHGSANLAVGAYRSGAVLILGQPPCGRAEACPEEGCKVGDPFDTKSYYETLTRLEVLSLCLELPGCLRRIF